MPVTRIHSSGRGVHVGREKDAESRQADCPGIPFIVSNVFHLRLTLSSHAMRNTYHFANLEKTCQRKNFNLGVLLKPTDSNSLPLLSFTTCCYVFGPVPICMMRRRGFISQCDLVVFKRAPLAPSGSSDSANLRFTVSGFILTLVHILAINLSIP